MDKERIQSDLHYLRDVVARTQSSAVNHFWPVSLTWGCIITFGYIAAVALARAGQMTLLA